MKVCVMASGSRGDIQPLFVLGVDLARRGHHVSAGVPPNFVTLGAAAGLRTLGVGPDTRGFLSSQQIPIDSGSIAYLRKLSAVAHGGFRQISSDLASLAVGADVIITSFLTSAIALTIGEAYEVPVVIVDLFPRISTAAYPCFIATTRQLGTRANRLSWVLVHRLLSQKIDRDVADLRRLLGMPQKRAERGSLTGQLGALSLQAYSRQLAPLFPPDTPKVPQIGPLLPDAVFRRRTGEAGLDPDLADWLNAGKAPIYFGFGSMRVPLIVDAIRMIDTVCGKLGLRALVCLGWSDVGLSSISRSPQTYVVQSVDHSAVLPRCRAAVHHGGAGTTFACAVAGLPCVICPMVLDQHFWAARLCELGTGRTLPYRQLSSDALSRELRALLIPSVEERAKSLSLTLEDAFDARSKAVSAVELCTSAG